MDFYNANKNKRVTFITAGLLVVSIVLNGVLFRNLITGKSTIETKQFAQIKEKEAVILDLQEEIESLRSNINNNTPEDKNITSKTELEKQQEYKNIATKFINDYLNYNTNSLNERRDKLSKISTKELVDKVAPEETANQGEALSSDPFFTSEINDMKIYTTGINNELNSSEILADVSYVAKGSEGESIVRTFIYLKLQSNSNGKIQATDFMYYPIN